MRNPLGGGPGIEPGRWIWWRRAHLLASGLLTLVAAVHCAVTPIVYSTWSAGAVWFLGTGLGLLLLGALNLTHVGVEPCQEPTARLTRWANWLFLVFGLGTLAAVPELQAMAIVLALAVQAVAAHRTLPGPA
jgi:hypothetical protein